MSEEEWQYQCQKMIFARTDYWLDREPAVRHLESPALAQIVADSIFHFADERYALISFVVMPSHFHWVFRPLEAWEKSLRSNAKIRRPREIIMKSLKTWTARNCNQILKTEGAFWQQESYDHCVRDDEELYRVIEYVERNPVKAGLVSTAEEWIFTSARLRQEHGIRFGDAIRKKHRL